MLDCVQTGGVATLHQPNWYAIQTRSRHEKKVADEIQHKGIRSFLPLVTRLHRWSDRQKEVQLPLFPGYVFVHTAPSDKARISVLQTPGVAQPHRGSAVGETFPRKSLTPAAFQLTIRMY